MSGSKKSRVTALLSSPGGPAMSDLEIARQTGSSRALVRKVRAELGALSDVRIVKRGGQTLTYRTSKGPPPDAASPHAPIHQNTSTGTWRPALEPIFRADGAAAQVEEALTDLLEASHRLGHLLARLEVQPRGKRFGSRRHELVMALVQAIRNTARAVIPVAPCPFCGIESASAGCGRCDGTGWAPPDAADLFASIQQRQSRSHWWRRVSVELVP